VYDDQIKLKSEYEVMGRENQGEEQEERRPLDSARTQTTTTHSATHPNTNKYSANSKQIKPFDHNSKTPKSGREWTEDRRSEESQEGL